MGLYLEVPGKKFKAQQLVDLHGAVRINDSETERQIILNSQEYTLICVMENDDFDAARIVPDKEDYNYITMDRDDDDRPRTFLAMPTDLVEKLNPIFKRSDYR